MQEAEGNMRPELTDRSHSPRDESAKVRRKMKQLDKAKRKQIKGEKGNITYMNNETGHTLSKNAMHNTTAIGEAGGKKIRESLPKRKNFIW
jgi:hypothetical protein